jgi:diacylglycerol kinase
LAFGFLILLLLGGLQSAIQMLALVVLAVLPKVVALINTCLEAEIDFFDRERHGVHDFALPCSAFEIASVLDPTCMIFK